MCVSILLENMKMFIFLVLSHMGQSLHIHELGKNVQNFEMDQNDDSEAIEDGNVFVGELANVN